MASSTEPHVLVGTTVPLRGIRRAAERQMIAAWQAPAFHLSVDVDMTRALGVKHVHPGATVTDLLVAVSARALVEHPDLNAHYSEDGVTTFEEINVGIAVSTEAGLMVPNIHGVQTLSISGIAEVRREVVERARARKLSMGDITGGTFTISNLGMFGIDSFDAILNVPQVAILAVGSTSKRYVWRDDSAQWLPIATLTLTCDHRAVDGATGAAFLSRVRELLEGPITEASFDY